MLTIYLCVVALLVVGLMKKCKPYPPGPLKLPLIGNLLEMPLDRQWVKFSEWARQYGPIVHVTVGPQHIVILNTPEVINDLFVQRSRIFSDRLAPHVASEILSARQRLLYMSGLSEEFKAIRKLYHGAMGPNTARTYRDIQELESRVLVHDLIAAVDTESNFKQPKGYRMANPSQHWYSFVDRFNTSVILTVTYGKRIPNYAIDDVLQEIQDTAENVARCSMPGAFMADHLPILRYLPDFLAPWRLKAQKMHEREIELYGSFLDEIRSDMKKGISRPDCLVGNYLKERAEHGLEELPGKGLLGGSFWMRDILLTYTAGTLLEAGSDGTGAVMKTFILFMVAHPDVLEKVQAEMDAVVGPERLPLFEDQERLPYFMACLKEVLRCRSPAPIGVPHSPSEDIHCQNYLIPKGSVVFGNLHGLHLDPKRFPEPHKFLPERWLHPMNGESVKLNDVPDPSRDLYAFGWGRRYCPGSHVAESSLFIALSRLIWGIEIRAVDLKSGTSTQDPWNEESYTPGFISNPRPFKVPFRPRSARHVQVIRNAFEEAQAQWEILGMDKDGMGLKVDNITSH
ncbi:hypothetical protein VNI00_010921 [Paramarasmius palmivorus]|uniref:Cytochrome P450 n=1 Tax=Paramarasmius palmivorus TaxID=297713 RepID=A0AAW0CF72_9AGAR